jgi:hypothetical protein
MRGPDDSGPRFLVLLFARAVQFSVMSPFAASRLRVSFPQQDSLRPPGVQNGITDGLGYQAV